ncbi:TBC1 domain family member 5 homolog A-like [Bombus pyrosoma]|uniref:TBC1 domain family member 5 homolog A-like n=1 Tax=Bombus pyrosoma TaxID=396416 RepID=UPI001CB8D62C|nr:TBC1 domain family member 5 homolog A-like [Bombus pyrosoma]
MKQRYSVKKNFKMRKSPLSTPSGSKEKQNYNWKSNGYKNRTDYSYRKSDSYQCTSSNGSQRYSGNDFIPLNNSMPVPEYKKFNNNWHGSEGHNHRNSGSGGFNHYRNNYHSTSKLNFNNSYSPYKHSVKQLFYGQKKGFQKDKHRQSDISCYIDMKSFLEDPWAELTKKLMKDKEINGNESPKIELSLSSQLACVDTESYFESKSISSIDNSCFSPESKSESSIDAKLGLDDTDISNVSRIENSIDLKLDNVRFSQESKNDSVCNNSGDSVNEGIHNEDNVNNINDICSSKMNIIQDLK